MSIQKPRSLVSSVQDAMPRIWSMLKTHQSWKNSVYQEILTWLSIANGLRISKTTHHIIVNLLPTGRLWLFRTWTPTPNEVWHYRGRALKQTWWTSLRGQHHIWESMGPASDLMILIPEEINFWAILGGNHEIGDLWAHWWRCSFPRTEHL